MSFVVHHRDRQRLAEALRSRGVDTTTGYMNDMAHHDLFRSSLPSVPMHRKANAELLHIPGISEPIFLKDRQHIAQSVIEACAELG